MLVVLNFLDPTETEMINDQSNLSSLQPLALSGRNHDASGRAQRSTGRIMIN